MKMSRKKWIVTGLSVGAALASVAAPAEEGSSYAELGYARLTLSSGGYSVSPSDAIARFGYNLTKNFGVEVMGAVSVANDTLSGASFKVDSAYGAYLKGQLEAAPNLELFAKAGWVRATLTGSAMGISLSSSNSSFSYAAGLQYRVNKNWYAQGDYASYYDKSGETIKGPSLSVGYRF